MEKENKKQGKPNQPVNPGVTKQELLAQAENQVTAKHKHISNMKTPKSFVKEKNGHDYVEEAFMREMLNKYFSIWSWEVQQTQFLGSEWCVVTGELQIMDTGFPRKFGSIGAARIQFKKGKEHTPENVVDVDLNVAAANTNALKRAINRLCNIADDVYRKQVVDVELNKEQLEKIKSLAKDVEDLEKRDQIINSTENNAVNALNYDTAIKSIKNIIKEEGEKNG